MPTLALALACACSPWVDEAASAPIAQSEPPTSPERPVALPRSATPAVVGDRELGEDELLGLPGSQGLAVAIRGASTSPDGGHSIGTPQGGALVGGVQLPFDPAAYTRRDAGRSWATSQTVRTIAAAFSSLRRDRGVAAEVVIGDLSLPSGGAFGPHVSHRSGRDIDIRLVLAPGLDRTTLPLGAEQVDWDATWALVHSFLETGRVTHVFFDFARQEHLHRAALRAGVHPQVVDHWFQWPGGDGAAAVIRHEPGHRAHVHVRLDCEGQGPRCQGA